MKIFIACDKFKGSLESSSVNKFIEAGILSVGNNIQTSSMQMADGGEGSLAIISENIPGKQKLTKSFDALRREILCTYFEDEKGSVYLESAMIIGLSMLKKEEKNPLLTSSFGIGWIIKKIVQSGIKDIHLFCGGSSTNDGGAGILEGLGYQFTDKSGNVISTNGGNLIKIDKIICPKEADLPDFILHIWTDVDIPLLGETGCSLLYSKQKGATAMEAEFLEQGLKHFIHVVQQYKGKNSMHEIRGSGAAGGIPFGCMSFLKCTLGKASNLLFECSNVEQKIASSNLVVTGEGSLDRQTIQGKLVQQISAIAKKYQKTCWVVCGQNHLSNADIHSLGISKVFSILDLESNSDLAITNAGKYLEIIGIKIGKEFGA